jgi:hypothetical protein
MLTPSCIYGNNVSIVLLMNQEGENRSAYSIVVVVNGGNGSTNGLYEEGYEIAGAEDNGIRAWFETAQILAIYDNYPSEAEVDTGRDESWTDGQRDEVDEESIVIEGVIEDHNSPNISDNLSRQAAAQHDHVSPCLVSDAKE